MRNIAGVDITQDMAKNWYTNSCEYMHDYIDEETFKEHVEGVLQIELENPDLSIDDSEWNEFLYHDKLFIQCRHCGAVELNEEWYYSRNALHEFIT